MEISVIFLGSKITGTANKYCGWLLRYKIEGNTTFQ
jgi:hypothetical protein